MQFALHAPDTQQASKQPATKIKVQIPNILTETVGIFAMEFNFDRIK